MKRIGIVVTISILVFCLSTSISFARRQRVPVEGDMTIEILFEPPEKPYKQIGIETVASRFHNQAINLAECIKLLQKKASSSNGDAIILIETAHISLDGTRSYATGIIIEYIDKESFAEKKVAQ
ncbi:MAG: hypothetical protein ABFQ82_03850 [Thermodesulfobacteriota bacterium]